MSDGGEQWSRPLEGWKEISAYLKRDESTARRWEREEGLPVHRHEHRKRSSVYADRGELEAWRSARSPSATITPDGKRPSFVGMAAAAAAATALTLISGGDRFQPLAEMRGSGGTTPAQTACTDCSPGRWASSDRLTESNGRSEIAGPRVLATGEPLSGFAWLTPCGPREIGVDERAGGEPLLVSSPDDLREIQPHGWSPSGEILVSARSDDWSTLLGFVPAMGGELRVVKRLPSGEPSVHLSPDGRWIAYDVPSRADEPQRDVYLLAADGSREFLVGGHPANDYAVGFTAGSDDLLFASNRTGSYGLWAAEIHPSGAVGEPRLLQRDTGVIVPLSITADGALYYAPAPRERRTSSASEPISVWAPSYRGRSSSLAGLRVQTRGLSGPRTEALSPVAHPQGRFVTPPPASEAD